MRCSVEGACEEVDWGWDVELVGKEKQEVVLVDLELVAWMVEFRPLGEAFQVYDFNDVYDLFTISC